ncbi:unnamed protein product [marine sediment metagenome]|uniref:Uncharacterized protein n=1 Tax=marine sediment metagenome TaxID=412755 RepID=X1B5K7_9ZZZZ
MKSEPLIKENHIIKRAKDHREPKEIASQKTERTKGDSEPHEKENQMIQRARYNREPFGKASQN